MLKNNSEEQKISYTQVMSDSLIAYNSIGIPKISEPTEEEQQQLDKIDIDKLDTEEIKQMSNRKLLHLNSTLYIEQKYVTYFIGHFLSFFGSNIYMAMYLRKHGKRFYSKASGIYKQVVIKGTLISVGLYAYFLGGVYLIFRNQRPVLKSQLRTKIYEELVYRNSLYDDDCRQALLANALKFYRFSPEFINNTMNQIDSNLEKEFGSTPDLYLEPI